MILINSVAGSRIRKELKGLRIFVVVPDIFVHIYSTSIISNDYWVDSFSSIFHNIYLFTQFCIIFLDSFLRFGIEKETLYDLQFLFEKKKWNKLRSAQLFSLGIKLSSWKCTRNRVSRKTQYNLYTFNIQSILFIWNKAFCGYWNI